MPENHFVHTVREATIDDIDGVVEALSDAFENDPVMSLAMGGAHQLEKVKKLFRFQIEKTYLPSGSVDIALTRDGKIVGAALWISPEGQKGSLLQDIRELPAYAKILGPSFLKGIYTELKLLSARPKFPHWYLYTIGVHEDARSQGVGSALLDFRRAKLGYYPAYLEASTFRSAALYRRHGFIELGNFKNGKPAIGMWHPAPESSIDRGLEKSAPKR